MLAFDIREDEREEAKEAYRVPLCRIRDQRIVPCREANGQTNKGTCGTMHLLIVSCKRNFAEKANGSLDNDIASLYKELARHPVSSIHRVQNSAMSTCNKDVCYHFERRWYLIVGDYLVEDLNRQCAMNDSNSKDI